MGDEFRAKATRCPFISRPVVMGILATLDSNRGVALSSKTFLIF